MGADCEEYIIALPEAMIIPNHVEDKTVDYTYYLQDEGDKIFIKISSYLKIIRDAGFIVAVRAHPRYTPKSYLKIFSDFEIKDNGSMTTNE